MTTPAVTTVPRLLGLEHEIERQAQARLVGRVALDTGNALPSITYQSTPGGDPQLLRGIPVVGARGVSGTSPGTSPGGNLR